jgi:hypothetical protein
MVVPEPLAHRYVERRRLSAVPRSASTTCGIAVSPSRPPHILRVHQTMLTTRLDEDESAFDIRAGGRTAGRIINRYHEEDGGVRFYAETQVGIDSPAIGTVCSHTVRPFRYRKTSGEHWIRHSIEETGCTRGAPEGSNAQSGRHRFCGGARPFRSRGGRSGVPRYQQAVIGAPVAYPRGKRIRMRPTSTTVATRPL